MIAPRWQKVFKDLWRNKTRTLLVVLSIAVGTFAVGVIINAQLVLSTSLNETYEATNPAHATIMTLTPFDEDLAETARNVDGIAEAEARRSVVVRAEIGEDEWINLQLMAIPDYDDIRVSKVLPDAGVWPPEGNDLLIERSALGLLNAQVGDTLTIKTPKGDVEQITIAGTSQDLQASLFVLGGLAYGHINQDMLEWLGEPNSFNELHVRVEDDAIAAGDFKAAIDDVQDKVESSGRTIMFTLTQPPGQLPADYIVQAILAILGAVGILSLLLSGFLIVNTISAVLMQQVKQIGIMKTFGARTGQLVRMYLVMVLLYGGLALIIALPLSTVSAYAITRLIGDMLNFNLTAFQISPLALGIQVAIALLVPLTAGLVPVLSGTRVTVREAISGQDLGAGQFGTNRIDRLLTEAISRRLLNWISRPAIISLRNTFRRKNRLLLTLITLILGGTIFISIASLQASLRSTLDSWLAYYQYDVAVQMARPYRVESVKNVLMEIPGVVHAEGWGFYNVRRARPDGTDSGGITLYAPPPETSVVKPTVVEGRWLLPDDENAVVLSTMVLRTDPDIAVGDEIMLKFEGQEEPWTVVGLAQGGSPIAAGFVSYDALAHTLNSVGKAEYVMIVTEGKTAAEQVRMSAVIEDALTGAGYRVGLAAPASLDKQAIESTFQIILALLLVVAAVLAAVGGLGLMGTMSINVLERTREVGVMRAIGASTGSIMRIIVGEGMLIGVISWLIGTALALPLSRFLSNIVGDLFLSSSLDYKFSITGTIGWLILVIVLAALASLLPALNAARLTVREILAYE